MDNPSGFRGLGFEGLRETLNAKPLLQGLLDGFPDRVTFEICN